MTDFHKVDQTIRAQLEASLAELGRLCAQPSVSASGEGIRECAALVSEMLQRRGFKVQIFETPGWPIVYGDRPGSGDRTLLFYNHYDVQPPEPLELWDTPPFQPSIRGGKMYARGVSDDKGHIECRLAALDALLAMEADLPCRIKFVIEGEEETGSVTLPGFVRGHKELLAADACLWEFGGVDHEGTPIQYAGLRGITYVELTVQTASQDAHSGLGGSIFPNAAWRLTWALNSLKGPDERIRLPGFYDKVRPPTARDMELLALLPDESEELLTRYGLKGFIKGLTGGVELRREAIFTPTCTICGLNSGYQGPGSKTVQPANASAKVDFRLVPDMHPDDVLQQLRMHLDRQGFTDIQITDMGSEPPARTDPDDLFLQLVVQSAAEVYGRPQLITPMSGGSGPNHAFVHDLKVPVATVGVGYPGNQVHAPNENLVIENFVNGVRHTARVVAKFAEM
ncbi:MAG TPA: M20/M25/M40 family metallo-hydrolase [Anaerolineales bacterium]|nr:M20/M25/M40 family metallo-hydrolase [Anaerolineales bacterium]